VLGKEKYTLTSKIPTSEYSILLITGGIKANTSPKLELVASNKESTKTIKFELNELPPQIRDIIDKCKSSTVTYVNGDDDEEADDFIAKNIDPCLQLQSTTKKPIFNVVRKFLEKKYGKKE
jgi:hypothetical protein